MPFRKYISRLLKYLSCSHQKPKVLITIRYLVLLPLRTWHSLTTALINLPDQVHPLPPEIIFFSISSEFIFLPYPPQISKIHFKSVQNNYLKYKSFIRFHFKCSLSFMKDQRGILQKDKLHLKISSWCLYSQVPLFVFLPNDGESSTGIFLQFSNSVIQLLLFLSFPTYLLPFLPWLVHAPKVHEQDYGYGKHQILW